MGPLSSRQSINFHRQASECAATLTGERVVSTGNSIATLPAGNTTEPVDRTRRGDMAIRHWAAASNHRCRRGGVVKTPFAFQSVDAGRGVYCIKRIRRLPVASLYADPSPEKQGQCLRRCAMTFVIAHEPELNFSTAGRAPGLQTVALAHRMINTEVRQRHRHCCSDQAGVGTRHRGAARVAAGRRCPTVQCCGCRSPSNCANMACAAAGYHVRSSRPPYQVSRYVMTRSPDQ